MLKPVKIRSTVEAAIENIGSYIATLQEGDVLHIRYSTFNESETKRDLIAIVGEQNYNEEKKDTI